MLTEKELLKLEYDKHQLQFAIDGTLIISQKVIDEQTPLTALINKSHYWICPFCLVESNNFTIENKGLVICSNCLIGMRMKTLLFVKDCTNKEYATWVFEYRLSGFFTKLKSGNNSFENWVKKMKDLGISYDFWNRYKELKGDYEEEQKPEILSYDSMQKFINVLTDKIKKGITKEQIINELYDVDVSIENIEYCFNEAEMRVKNGNY